MTKFVLHWTSGKSESVEGDDIADACLKAGIGQRALILLDRYHEEDREIRVAGAAQCGCVYHAEEGLACRHDLERVGLN